MALTVGLNPAAWTVTFSTPDKMLERCRFEERAVGPRRHKSVGQVVLDRVVFQFADDWQRLITGVLAIGRNSKRPGQIYLRNSIVVPSRNELWDLVLQESLSLENGLCFPCGGVLFLLPPAR